MINYLNNNPEEYEKLLELERALVQQFVIDYPKFWLEKAVEFLTLSTILMRVARQFM